MTKETLLRANLVFDNMMELRTVLSYIDNNAYLAIRTPQGATKALNGVLPSELYNKTLSVIKESIQQQLADAEKEFEQI